MPALTVGQLVEQLSALDPELPVVTDGCDCYGWAQSVSIIPKSHLFESPYTGAVLIERGPGS